MIDANGAILGRLLPGIADTFAWKNKPIYTSHLDAGDFVVVINAGVAVTGQKKREEFRSYSGWLAAIGAGDRTVIVRAKTPEKPAITTPVRAGSGMKSASVAS